MYPDLSILFYSPDSIPRVMCWALDKGLATVSSFTKIIGDREELCGAACVGHSLRELQRRLRLLGDSDLGLPFEDESVP